MGTHMQILNSIMRKINAMMDRQLELEDQRITLLEEKGRLIEELKKQKSYIEQLENEIKILKVSKGITGEGPLNPEAKKKINELIDEIDHCIAALGY